MRRTLAALTLAATTIAGIADNAEARGLRIPAGARKVYASGACDYLEPYLENAGLPVTTFELIAARESGCRAAGVRVNRRDDLSTSRFGLNFRTAGLRRYWAQACGATHWTQPGADLTLDVTCAAAAYHELGLRPWGA